MAVASFRISSLLLTSPAAGFFEVLAAFLATGFLAGLALGLAALAFGAAADSALGVALASADLVGPLREGSVIGMRRA